MSVDLFKCNGPVGHIQEPATLEPVANTLPIHPSERNQSSPCLICCKHAVLTLPTIARLKNTMAVKRFRHLQETWHMLGFFFFGLKCSREEKMTFISGTYNYRHSGYASISVLEKMEFVFYLSIIMSGLTKANLFPSIVCTSLRSFKISTTETIAWWRNRSHFLHVQVTWHTRKANILYCAQVVTI